MPTNDEIEDGYEVDLFPLVLVYAKHLGIDIENEKELLDIARDALTHLPAGWELGIGQTCQGTELYFYDQRTERSVWNHPEEDKYIKMVLDARKNTEKEKLQQRETKPMNIVEESNAQNQINYKIDSNGVRERNLKIILGGSSSNNISCCNSSNDSMNNSRRSTHDYAKDQSSLNSYYEHESEPEKKKTLVNQDYDISNKKISSLSSSLSSASSGYFLHDSSNRNDEREKNKGRNFVSQNFDEKDDDRNRQSNTADRSKRSQKNGESSFNRQAITLSSMSPLSTSSSISYLSSWNRDTIPYRNVSTEKLVTWMERKSKCEDSIEERCFKSDKRRENELRKSVILLDNGQRNILSERGVSSSATSSSNSSIGSSKSMTNDVSLYRKPLKNLTNEECLLLLEDLGIAKVEEHCRKDFTGEDLMNFSVIGDFEYIGFDDKGLYPSFQLKKWLSALLEIQNEGFINVEELRVKKLEKDKSRDILDEQQFREITALVLKEKQKRLEIYNEAMNEKERFSVVGVNLFIVIVQLFNYFVWYHFEQL